MSHGAVKRFIAFVGLSLQLSAAGTAALADARLDAASAKAAAHIESHSNATCVVLHPENCALCRFLSAYSARTPAQVVAISDRRVVALPSRDDASVVTRVGLPSPSARAPPSFS